MEKKEEKKEDSGWEKQYKLPLLDNYLPILKTMLAMLENEKKLTLEKIEESKKTLEKIKNNKK
jgi:hypothetical protein